MGHRGIIWPTNVLNSCHGNRIVYIKSHADAVSDTDAIRDKIRSQSGGSEAGFSRSEADDDAAGCRCAQRTDIAEYRSAGKHEHAKLGLNSNAIGLGMPQPVFRPGRQRKPGSQTLGRFDDRLVAEHSQQVCDENGHVDQTGNACDGGVTRPDKGLGNGCNGGRRLFGSGSTVRGKGFNRLNSSDNGWHGSGGLVIDVGDGGTQIVHGCKFTVKSKP